MRDAYREGTFPEVRCYELMSWAFAGFRVEEAYAFVDQVQHATRLETRLHPEMVELISWATARDVEVWIVSASPTLVVERGARHLGIPAHRIVAAAAVVNDGVVAARLAEPIPYGAGKVKAMERAVGAAEIVAAFGDNAFDLEMLSRAAVPVAVRPKDRLRVRGADLPQLVELAPG
jgi:HAD superfamily phosphoserine phosphatase-like hydrolase